MKKEYLGDSVYVIPNKIENGAIILTTENGLPTDPSNIIALEPDVLDALVDYVERMRKEPT